MKYFLIALTFLFSGDAAAGPFITGNSVFIGEAVGNNPTLGAPLSVSSTGAVATGITSYEVTGTANVTTTNTSSTAQTVLMTYTPPAGTYLVIFSTWCYQNTANDVIYLDLFNGTTLKTDSVRQVLPFGLLTTATLDVPVTINGIVTANGTSAISIQWYVNGGTGTCGQRTFDLVRIS